MQLCLLGFFPNCQLYVIGLSLTARLVRSAGAESGEQREEGVGGTGAASFRVPRARAAGWARAALSGPGASQRDSFRRP